MPRQTKRTDEGQGDDRPQRRCATMDVHERLLRTDAAYVNNRMVSETNAVLGLLRRTARTGICAIPTVVHVVSKTAAQNISDAQIQSQIDVLNRDFRMTNGITRTTTTANSFTDDDKVKSASTGGADAWPTDRYLNIWVCQLTPWLGYAQFPGGPAATDGVVVLHTAFGTTGTAAA